jgi:hypothetical protein
MRTLTILGISCVLAACIAGCSQSPTAPSESIVSSASDATVRTSGNAPLTLNAARPTTHPTRINIRGVVGAIDTDARTITVNSQVIGVPISAEVVAADGSSLAFEDIIVDNRVHVLGTSLAGMSTAERIEILDVTISGPVADLAGSCPDLTFSVNGQLMTTTDATEFARGECAGVANDIIVEVRGTLDAGVFTALRVQLPAHEAPAPHQSEHASLDGAIADLSGACPARTFKIGATVIAVTAATEFARGVCDDLANDKTVTAKGAIQLDGSVIADVVQFENPHQPTTPASDHSSSGSGSTPATPATPATPDGGSGSGTPATPASPAQRDVQISGAASAVTGACPSLVFTLGGQSVHTDASTQFIGGGSCANVVNGKSVDVTGTQQTGFVLATRLKVSKK